MTTTPVEAWEYQILLADMRPGGMDEVNKAGREGWEAVTGTSGGNRLIVLLKRRVAAGTDRKA